jgi:predicted  nucleic acid-binding Zn-ribbon protein
MTQNEALLRLQEIDLSLAHIEGRTKEMPDYQRLQQVEAARKKLASQLTQLMGKRKDLEMEYEDRISAKERLFGIRDEVQAKAMSGEASFRSVQEYEQQLSALAKGIEKAEYDEQRLGAELERYEAAEAKAHTMSDELKAQSAELTQRVGAQIAEMRAEVQNLLAERARLVEFLDDALVARYDKARKRFKTIAVETLNGNVPTGCRVALRPSDYADLRHAAGKGVMECPYCHRLLVMEEA